MCVCFSLKLSRIEKNFVRQRSGFSRNQEFERRHRKLKKENFEFRLEKSKKKKKAEKVAKIIQIFSLQIARIKNRENWTKTNKNTQKLMWIKKNNVKIKIEDKSIEKKFVEPIERVHYWYAASHWKKV